MMTAPVVTTTIPSPADVCGAARAAYRAGLATTARVHQRTSRAGRQAARDAHTLAVRVLGAPTATQIAWRGYGNGTATWQQPEQGLSLLYSGGQLYTQLPCAACLTL